MHRFNEELLQFIWQHRLLKPVALRTQAGHALTIVKPGELNRDAGPDFFNAQIKLNGLLLAGNVELHLKTSDWLKHGHQRNARYDHLILHVVYEHDVELEQNQLHHVEVLELKDVVADETIATYSALMSAAGQLPCNGQLDRVNEIKLLSWLQRMAIERLEDKIGRVEQLFAASGGDYAQTFYTLLLRSFGFKVNALPLELLARQLPLAILLKHADNLLQLEALLLGMAGLLEQQFENKYVQQLQNEFDYLQHKYHLQPLQKEVFKFSALRPANSPNLRLAQLAALLHARPALFTSPQQFDTYDQLKAALKIQLQGYWKNHYVLDGKLSEKDLNFGATSAESIIINAFAPFFFFYGRRLGKPAYCDTALELLQAAGFEHNAKTKLFSVRKAELKSAADSQAIINLYDHYCSKKRCLNCGIAVSLLAG